MSLKFKDFNEEQLETRGIDGFLNITKGTTGVSMAKTAISSGKARGLKYNEEYGLLAQADTQGDAEELFDAFIEKYILEPLEGKGKKEKKAPAKQVSAPAKKEKKAPAKKEKKEEVKAKKEGLSGKPKPMTKITVDELNKIFKEHGIETKRADKKADKYQLYLKLFQKVEETEEGEGDEGDEEIPKKEEKKVVSPKEKPKKEEKKVEPKKEVSEKPKKEEKKVVSPKEKKVEPKKEVTTPPVSPKHEKKTEKGKEVKIKEESQKLVSEKKKGKEISPKSPREIAGIEEEVSTGEVISPRVPVARKPQTGAGKVRTKEEKYERLIRCWTESKVSEKKA